MSNNTVTGAYIKTNLRLSKLITLYTSYCIEPGTIFHLTSLQSKIFQIAVVDFNDVCISC